VTTIDEQLVKYLADAHSIEEQALAQLRSAPDAAGQPELARVFKEHLAETEEHERLVRSRLEAHDAAPSRVKDIAGKVGGFAFILFAKSQPDTPGKLVAHAHSYEALELAAYELLQRAAERAGDQDTVATARQIADQERAMRDRLAERFDLAVDAALAEKDGSRDLKEDVLKYLADAHALEAQAIQLLERGPKIAGESQLAHLFEEHLEETRVHQQRVAERLEALDGSPSRIKDAAMRLGALNWGAFFQAQPDTPGKLAGFAFAFEHLEIAGYELLKRVAQRAGDTTTAELAESIAGEERVAAGKIASTFDGAIEASLQAQGVLA